MKISLGMFLVLLDALMGSTSIVNDNGTLFRYTLDDRKKVLNLLLENVSQEEIDMTLIKS